FTLRYSYSHHAKEGHLVKSRALNNFIIANRIMDELPVADGGTMDQSSALIDLPQGGRGYIIGNLLHKGSNSQNKNAAIWFARENGNNAPHELYVVNNTYVSATALASTAMILAARVGIAFVANNLGLGDGVTLLNFDPAESAAGRVFTVVNNYVDDALGQITLFDGATSAPADITYSYSGNQHILDAKLVNRAGFDWRLDTGSPAINNGVDPGSAHGVDLSPVAQYLHPTTGETRPQAGPLDIGAYEAQAGTPIVDEPATPTQEDDDGIITGPPNPNTPPPPPPEAAENTDDMLAGGARIDGVCTEVGGSSWLAIGVLAAILALRARSRKRWYHSSTL
ncbi:MAG TPA: choice-of-anchor Q domain-containing protein, partial [Myxococcota bacterium]|nr:choice-of-anchor Q domain-containing protein [Myxococcota bacterium]